MSDAAGVSLKRYMERTRRSQELQNAMWATIQDMRVALLAVPVCSDTAAWWQHHGDAVNDLRDTAPTPPDPPPPPPARSAAPG